MSEDLTPRYTTRRLQDEIAKAREYGRQEAADAAAQADYEQRIRSALIAPSPDLPEGDAVQTIAVPEGTRVIVKMGAACDMIIRHPKEDGRCPRSCNHRPDDFSMRDCIEAGECGCIAFPSPIDKGEVK